MVTISEQSLKSDKKVAVAPSPRKRGRPRTQLKTGSVRLTGAEALVKVLKSAGVRDYFGIVGANLSGILKSIVADADLNYLGVRHEAAAVFMAASLFHASGKVAVCLGELGPGAFNLMAGMGTAYNNHLALLVVTSNMPTKMVAPPSGVVMGFDGEKLFEGATKWSFQVRDVRSIPQVAREALRRALLGSPGPVHLNIPADIMTGTAEFDVNELNIPLEYTFSPLGRQVDVEQIEKAASLLAQAKRPLLIAGGGVIQAEATEPFRSIMNMLGAPGIATQMGIGVVPTDSPLFIGHAGLVGGPAVVRAMKEADVVLAVGCRFSSWMWEDGKPIVKGWPYQELIHIDINPDKLGQLCPASVPIVGDAKVVLDKLAETLEKKLKSKQIDEAWLSSLLEEYGAHRAHIEELAAASNEKIHPATLAKLIGEVLPKDSLVVYDGGHTTFWSNELTPALEPRTRFNDPLMAQLGFGLPYAIGLKYLYPEKHVFNITGDGAFGFTLQELDTARRYGLNVINIIHNNASWGIIKSGQQRHGFELGTSLEGTDYAAIAKAFGCYGERVTQKEEIIPAIERALASNLPAVIDVEVFFDPHPSMIYFRASTPVT